MRLAIFVVLLGCASIVVAKPKQGEPCPAGKCAAGLTCIKFRGFAGAAGPELSSCEVRCSKAGKCKKGQHCVTIADGPGQVCRPDDKPAAGSGNGGAGSTGSSSTGAGTSGAANTGSDEKKPPAPAPSSGGAANQR